MTGKEFIEAHPEAEFVGHIKVGNKGCDEFYTDKASYRARRDKVWDSGHDFQCSILKGSL